MKGLFLMFCSIAILLCGNGDRPELSISNIESELIKDADSVIRYYNISHEIKSLSKRITKVIKTTTILNEEGIGSGRLVVGYNEGSEKVKGVKITIYDKEGKKIRKVDKDDISDLSNSYGSIASTARYKYYEYKANSYPFTIHLEYSLHSSNTLDLDTWWPVSYNQSVEHSEYNVLSNIEFPLMTKKINFQETALESDEVGNAYVIERIPAKRYEPLSPHYKNELPHMMICPKNFSFEGVEGSITNWKDFGKWFYSLNDTQDDITSKMILDIESEIDDNDDQLTKARKIYDYVAENMRYVSIQLGIGGFQPFAADEVHDLKYGDCKGLSNYTKTLLNYYGIKALYTVIESNNSYNYNFDAEMPDLVQGNHVILCLPDLGDTTYLECTSKDLPFGYISSSNHNRNVLLVTEKGGVIAKTTKYNDGENLIDNKIRVVCDENFNAKMNRKVSYSNIALDAQRWKVDLTPKEQEKMISVHEKGGISDYNLMSYSIDQSREEPLITEEYIVDAANFSKKLAKYRMLPVNLFSLNVDPDLALARSSDIYIKDGFKHEISIHLTIPLGYSLVTDDTSFSLSNNIGSLTYDINMETDSTITLGAEVIHHSGIFSPLLAYEYNEFQEAKRKFLKTNIVLKPKS